jgi:deoxyhypusine synthase
VVLPFDSGLRDRFFKELVDPFTPASRKISEILESLERSGYQGRMLGRVFSIIRSMLMDKDLVIYMGLAGSMAPAGMWKIISWMIGRGYIDVLVSTGANVSEDIYSGLGYPYARGSPCVDDNVLLELGIDRFYDIYADEFKYREMEKLIMEFMRDLPKDYIYSSAEFMYLFGYRLSTLGVESIASTAYRNNTPIFVPALVDSGYGIAYILAARNNYGRLVIDHFKDFEQMIEIASREKATGAIYIGGGVPKDIIQLITVARTLISSRKPAEGMAHKYAVQITTDLPQWGGLSGATLEEAVSWGKVRSENIATVNVDATIALPIIASALHELNIARRRKDMSWLFSEIEKLVYRLK